MSQKFGLICRGFFAPKGGKLTQTMPEKSPSPPPHPPPTPVRIDYFMNLMVTWGKHAYCQFVTSAMMLDIAMM